MTIAITLDAASLVGIEVFGIEHSPVELSLYAFGWLCGWFLLARPRHLPPSDAAAARPPVAVVIPARNEEESLPHLLGPLAASRRRGDRIVVVDDHSSDRTAAVARRFGAEVTTPPTPAPGWLGKPNACWHGANSVDAAVLVFLDADVRPGPTLLDDLAAEVGRHPDAVVSMQPWHTMPTVSEQPSILCNTTALMGCGAFTASGRIRGGTVAFGPVIAIDRATYLRSGGHAADGVRSRHTEDIGLARSVGRSRLFVGTPGGTTFRMYPTGLAELLRGWTRSFATGARSAPWWSALATFCWIFSMAGGWLAVPLVYPFTAIQLWIIGRRAGTIRPWAAVIFPVLLAVFVVIVARSLWAIASGRGVTWKGRQVDARTG